MRSFGNTTRFRFTTIIAFFCILLAHHDSSTTLVLSLSMSISKKNPNHSHCNSINRRDALAKASASLMGGVVVGLPTASNANAAETQANLKTESIDMAAIKEAQSKYGSAPVSAVKDGSPGIITSKDPSPLLTIRGGINGKGSIKIPRVGYSLYKTTPDGASRATSLALRAGVRHFDVGTLYGSNSEVAVSLKKYLDVGIDGLNLSDEKSELLDILDATKFAGDEHSLAAMSSNLKSSIAPAPAGSAGRRGRREGLFISHKLSNSEQSVQKVDVIRAVKAQITALGLGTSYLDMVSIHSPLTDKRRRLETYGALLELRNGGFVKSVGVCNYGIGALEEIKDSGLDLPSHNQLELSPFNPHLEVVSWCKKNGVAIGCSAWSKLSGANGPEEQWGVLANIAKIKGMTKAQVLARWSLQKGYICVPRSSSGSKVERLAIAENSYGGVNPTGNGFILTDEDMDILDGLNTNLKAGKLGRRDGWSDEDVAGPDWDPTEFV